MCRSELEEVFRDILETLYGSKTTKFTDTVRKYNSLFYQQLDKLQLKEPKDFPWAGARPASFKKILSIFLAAKPNKRPFAAKLAADDALLKALE